MPEVQLPQGDGCIARFALAEPRDFRTAGPGQRLSRIALSAAHVVADPLADVSPFLDSAVDMEATVRYREHLWDLGLGVAEGMDTAQRGTGLTWPAAQEVIRASVAAAGARSDASIYCGVGTEHVTTVAPDLDMVRRAYDEQLAFVQGLGSRVIVMASRALVKAARTPEDYAAVYRHILTQADAPVILHWLGDMFDPQLAGYWGTSDLERAMDTCLAVIADNADRVEGIKVSLLDKDREITMRRLLPDGVRMYTGDDFNYPELIEGDDEGHSEALLGIFDAIAPAASAGLLALTNGDNATYNDILAPTVPLSRELFRAPTQFYKTGVVFLAWLNEHQDHFVMLGGQQSARSIVHLSRVFRLASEAGLLRDPDLAAARMSTLLRQHGVGT